MVVRLRVTSQNRLGRMTSVSRKEAAGLGTAPPRRSCASSLTTRRLVGSGSPRTLRSIGAAMAPTDLPESPPLELTGRDLTIAQVAAVARQGRQVALATEARERIEASRSVIEGAVAAGRRADGVPTGVRG